MTNQIATKGGATAPGSLTGTLGARAPFWPNLDYVLTEAEAARLIGCSQDTLRREFRAGNAPPRVRISDRRIGYRLSAVYAWLDARIEQSGEAA